MENKISFKAELLLYILLSFIMTIDTLCVYNQDEEDILCLAMITRFFTVVIISIFCVITPSKKYFFGDN